MTLKLSVCVMWFWNIVLKICRQGLTFENKIEYDKIFYNYQLWFNNVI